LTDRPEAPFSIVAADPSAIEKLLKEDIFSVATAFIKGEFTVHGDIFSAIRFIRNCQPRVFAAMGLHSG
jgi:hypothetical protein